MASESPLSFPMDLKQLQSYLKIGKLLIKVISPLKEKITHAIHWETTRQMHHGCIHAIRRFSTVTRSRGPDHWDTEPVTEGIRELASHLLHVPKQKLHVTLKLIAPTGGNPADLTVSTLGRTGASSRPEDAGDSALNRVGNNSDFASLLGCSDGVTDWKRAYNVFHCPNLEKRQKYCCSRTNFLDFYRTSLVFPLRVEVLNSNQTETFGFVTIDSMSANIFSLPDIFDFGGDKLDEYATIIDASCLIHAIATVVDTLAMIMRSGWGANKTAHPRKVSRPALPANPTPNVTTKHIKQKALRQRRTGGD